MANGVLRVSWQAEVPQETARDKSSLFEANRLFDCDLVEGVHAHRGVG
jgi:hypothetical protein